MGDGIFCGFPKNPFKQPPAEIKGGRVVGGGRIVLGKEPDQKTPPQSYQINERFGEYYAERRFTMQSNSSFAAAVYVAARETPI